MRYFSTMPEQRRMTVSRGGSRRGWSLEKIAMSKNKINAILLSAATNLCLKRSIVGFAENVFVRGRLTAPNGRYAEHKRFDKQVAGFIIDE
jgi:hypothetical protein